MGRRTELTEYEKQRAEVVSRNQSMLAQLKVELKNPSLVVQTVGGSVGPWNYVLGHKPPLFPSTVQC